MTPLHLAALNGNENILEIIGKSNLNSRDYRARKPDQLLGPFIPTLKPRLFHVKSNAAKN